MVPFAACSVPPNKICLMYHNIFSTRMATDCRSERNHQKFVDFCTDIQLKGKHFQKYGEKWSSSHSQFVNLHWTGKASHLKFMWLHLIFICCPTYLLILVSIILAFFLLSFPPNNVSGGCSGSTVFQQHRKVNLLPVRRRSITHQVCQDDRSVTEEGMKSETTFHCFERFAAMVSANNYKKR